MIRRQSVCRLAVTVLLLAAMAFTPLSTALAASAGDFGDISSSDWYYSSVDFVVGRGLFQGTAANVFSPNAAMTRGMFITVLGRYANVDAASWLVGTVTGSGVNLRSGAGTDTGVLATLGQGTAVNIKDRTGDWYQVSTASGDGYINASYVAPSYHGFSDVGYGKYYAGYAVWAYEKGVVTGDGSASTFNPNGNITRQEVCTMLSRFASVMGIGLSQSVGATTFADDGNISSWAKDSVYAMQRSGVVQGNETGSFNPRNPITRAETAAMMQRFDSACGGFSSAVQQPGGAPAPDTSVPGTSTPGTSTPGTTDPGTPPVDPGSVPDTPASQVGGSVGIQSSVIRVGVLVKTQGIDTSVNYVTLNNTNGYGFEFGSMSGRQFIAAGSVADGTVNISSDGVTLVLTDSVGNVLYSVTEGLAIHPVSGGKTVTRVNNEYRYYGDFEIRQASGKPGYMTVINYVNIEDYVKGVIPYEFINSWPTEMLKAAAIVARSYVMSYNWGIYGAYGMDIVTGAGTQLYRGRAITYDESYFAATDAAVDATSGLYLTYNGGICVACFSACNGGQTHDSVEVFGTSYPYLTAKADPYEQAAVNDITASGGSYEGLVSASHKVGMSAWGAYAMAKYYGKSCESILGFYYTGANLQYGA